jgi:hypothetical protein
MGEIGLEQGQFQRVLAALRFGPVQQAVRVEGVVDAAAAGHVEGEADRFAALADHLSRLDLLLERCTVFLGDVFDDVLAFGTHVGIEFEGLEMQLGDHVGSHALERLLQ